MYVEDIEDGVCSFYTTLHTELLILLLMSKVLKMSKIIFDIFNMLQHTQYLMVWLESPKSQLSKTFFQIEYPLNIKEVMSKNVWVCNFPIFDVFNIHSITALKCT